jgi:alpha-tubulin suppressor-like RCC1 family protein
VLKLSDATQISAGCCHGIALHADGTVTAWGYNGLGQLGDGTTTHSPTPVQVKGLTNVVAVDAGYEHNLALLADGTVMAWGDNYNGNLGVGGSDFKGGGPETCGTSQCSKVPVRVPGLTDVIAISANYYYNLALLANGTVMAWGYNYSGQMGDAIGSQTGCECVERPVRVPGISGAMAISTGEGHAAALLGDGTLMIWGENHEGQVGNGTTVDEAPPACLCVGVTRSGVPVPVQQISAGSYHNIAMRPGGSLQSWGYNVHGQLGNGTMSPKEGCECIPTPGAVAALTGVRTVAAGDYHSLALLSDGVVRAWGENFHGQLGDGTETERAVPTPVAGLSGVSEIFAGEQTSFALVGPSHTLTVALAGAGAGVVGGPEGIICPTINCAGSFPDSQVQILRAEAAPGSGFAGFTGPCTGTGPCRVEMDADQTVTATFGPPKGTKITRARIKQGKKPKKGAKRNPKPRAKANFRFSTPGAVTGYQCMLIKPKPKPKKGKKRKRAKPRFSKCASPKRYKKLRRGRYTFKVRARNILGVEAKPAVRKFRVRR